jgi:polysaccharide deacetylase family protein (PEP-CTERM system associated)
MKNKNIMSVDLEDFFCDLPFESWSKYESRVLKNTNKILDLFEKYQIKATFFTLGYIAEKFPDLIKKIDKKGHEIASHSYAHLDIRKTTEKDFENDVKKSIEILEKITGKKVFGFRAPYFSIDKKSFWAMKILSKYFKYDSSIFPVKTPLYGIKNAPRNIYKPNITNPSIEDLESKLIEIPLATDRIPIIGNIPIAGGFHLRFLPYFYIKYGLNKINKNNNSFIFYIHPKDLDPEMPKINEYAWHYYYNLSGATKKFEKILTDFEFCSVKDFLKLK